VPPTEALPTACDLGAVEHLVAPSSERPFGSKPARCDLARSQAPALRADLSTGARHRWIV